MKNVLILHGALGAKSQFHELEKRLKSHFNVWTLDFDGHGTNTQNVAFSIRHFASNTHTIIQQNGLENCLVFGYSMGGYVALYLEQSYPGSFERIVTLGTKFDWNVTQAKKEAGFLNPDQMEVNLPAYVTYLKGIHRESWKSVVEKTAQMMLDLGANPLLQEADFKQIKVPVTLMRGTKDKMVSQEETALVARALPQAKHIEIENWQHPIDRIDTEELAQQLLKLFTEQF